MRIIEGKNVDLITPFPLGEVKRIFGWYHCYRTICMGDDSPKTKEEFDTFMQEQLILVPSWGIVDKNHLTNTKHEAPLVGIVVFEPTVSPGTQICRNGFFHIATARRSWHTGLVDEAAGMVLSEIFQLSTILRVSAYMLEKNFPAKALCRRLGFAFEGIMSDAISQGGTPQNMALYGLTRRNYECLNSSGDSSEATLQPKPAPLTLEEVQDKVPLVEAPITLVTPQE